MRLNSKSPKRNTRFDNTLTPERVNQNFQPQKVKIAIRIRPPLNDESPEDFVNLVDRNTIKINRIGNTMMMKFSDILSRNQTQDDVINHVKEIIQQFMSGTNNTIFAYGQTGAGKTYTIIGNIPENVQTISNEKFQQILNSSQRGILPRALSMIVDALRQRPVSDQTKLYLSFYEVYNEKIYDLFDLKGIKDTNGLDIRENKNGDVQISDLSSILITDLQQAFDFLILGLRNRVTGCSHANSKSSRSHSIFQLTLQQTIDDQLIESQLKIVDLAGSEKFKIPQDLTPEERELHVQELTSINSSLSTLGHCISALIDRTRTHIPFRNSKLTRVLSDTLSGSGRISFIVCISPSVSAQAETFTTLQFANRAKKAILDGRNLKKQSVPKVAVVSLEEYQELYKMYLKEKALREEYEAALKKKNFGDLHQQIANLKAQNADLQEQLKSRPKSSNSRNQSLSDASKKVRFADDFLTAHIKQQLEYEESSLLENLSIFKEFKQLDANLNQKEPSKKSFNFEEKFKTYFGEADTDQVQKKTPQKVEPRRQDKAYNPYYMSNDLAQFNFESQGNGYDSILRQYNDKQLSISHISQDIFQEMSQAVKKLEELQIEDQELRVDSFQNSLGSSFRNYQKENYPITAPKTKYQLIN